MTSFIGELRLESAQQLLRHYSYELPEMDEMVSERAAETQGLDQTHQRASAIEAGIAATRAYFLRCGEGSQALCMSPINEANGNPEFEHTALYWKTFRNGKVEAWQLFVDFDSEERNAYMAWVARRADISYHAKTDLELASLPVCPHSPKLPLFHSLHEFIADIAEFQKMISGRASISGISLEDPDQFIRSQCHLEERNQQEAGNWVESYVRAIAQGSIELGKQIITKLQMKILGVTESVVRSIGRSLNIDLSTLQLFLKACGFLEFSFATGGSRELTSSPMIGLPTCQEKICKRCGTHAGETDTKCPSCGWSPSS